MIKLNLSRKVLLIQGTDLSVNLLSARDGCLGHSLQLILQTQILIPQIIEFRYLGITQVAVEEKPEPEGRLDLAFLRERFEPKLPPV